MQDSKMEAQANETTVNTTHIPTEIHMDDDKSPKEDQFQGATLEIRGDGAQMNPPVEFAGSGFDRNRPGSTMSRQSVRSTTSRTSLKPTGYKSPKSSEMFFCYKKDALDIAAENCKTEHYKADIDGNITGSWLLTEIDHWDNEREKIVMLTENSMLRFRYNFITNKVAEFQRVSLHIIDIVMVGDFRYPKYSVMPVVSNDREHGGIQIKYNCGELPSFGQRWNPWCSTIPWVTLAHHPLLYNPSENETVTYNVDEFYESLIPAISKAYNRRRPGEKVTVLEGPIEIQSYASVSSLVFNQSGIGYYKDRNGLCF